MHKRLTVEPFGFWFWFCTTWPEFLEATGTDPTGGDKVSGYVMRGTRNGVAHFFMYVPDDATTETLWHEALHLTTYMLNHAGVPVSHENDEILAYLQGHIVRLVERARRPPRTKTDSR